MAKRKHTSQKAAKIPDGKQARFGGKPDSFLTMNPVWSFSLMDKSHPRWSFNDNDSLYTELLCKLADLERMTWQQISSAAGGKKTGHGSESHFISVGDIIHEAQKRLDDLKQSDIGELYSLRIDGKKRLWGILTDGVFRVLWYDKEHEIYNSEKRKR